jgi:hypothetical protein
MKRIRKLLQSGTTESTILLPIKHIATGKSRAEITKRANEWFYRGRATRSRSSAELRRRAYQTKLQMRAQRANLQAAGQSSLATGTWAPLGPVPLASDATGNGTQDYHQVAGRATTVAIDSADASGNTVYIGGAQSGIWKSINAANATANGVTWTALTDAQATLSIGSIAIQPGNSDPAKSVILAATGDFHRKRLLILLFHIHGGILDFCEMSDGREPSGISHQ